MRIPSSLPILLILGCSMLLHAQDRSIMQEEWEAKRTMGIEEERAWDSVNLQRGLLTASRKGSYTSLQSAETCRVQGIVYGWHPYWQGTAYNDYDFSLLSDVCYFSYEVDPATGSYTSIHSWKTTGLVERAKGAGRRVHLCVTLFSGHATFLSNAGSRGRLIDSLVALVKLRDADGVNIDFEGVPSSEKARFISFVAELADRCHREIPGSQVSIAIPAVDWSNVYDVAAMSSSVDLFIIMGYDYHWRSSPNAGPVSPKNSGSIWSPYDVTRSINSYLERGVSASKLCLGLPYYGYEWGTTDSAIGATTIGSGAAVTYSQAVAKAGAYGRKWEPQSSTPYLVYRSDSVWKECWYDDEESLGAKYDLVRMKGLAGVGIWALGYDAGRGELWDALRNHLSECAAASCEGAFIDMGGPAGNYYADDDFIWTIAPAGAARVTLSFYSFSIADDTLWIYDGDGVDSPLIGAWSEQDSPGTITSRSGSITIRFRSNEALASWGWIANWNCQMQPGGIETRQSRDERLDLSRAETPRRRGAIQPPP